MNIKSLTSIQINENVFGKKEKILIIKCRKCQESEKDLLKNKICLSCFLKNLFLNKNEKLKHISIGSYDKLIDFEQFSILIDYFNKSQKIKSIIQEIQNIKKNKCKFNGFKCRVLPDLSSVFSFDEDFYSDPIKLYTSIQERLRIIKNRKETDVICQKCFNYVRKSFEKAIKILKELSIIKEFNNFKNRVNIIGENSKFYEYLLSKIYQIHEIGDKTKDFNISKEEILIKKYLIGHSELFQVSIYNILNESQNKYFVKLAFKSISEEEYFEKLIPEILRNLEDIKIDQIIPIEKLIKIYKKVSLKYINTKYNFSDDIKKKKICFLSALKKLNLEKIFPLLIDDYVEEIFLDSPEKAIYLNHQIYGRCQTEIKFNLKEIERLKTFIRLYSGERLDYMNPSIKYVIKNRYFYCRFAIDVEPIHLDNFALDIRKLNKNILTIQDLLKNKTLNSEMAAFLYFNILRRNNITVTGETDTGKTTLINALDLLAPKEFRKIYIENVIESLNESEFENHQLKFKVNSLDEFESKRYSKSNQIKKLLHRTPDIIYLGEILTKEEAEAMFHCLAAGLRGFQTIHSSDIDSLINRFIYHFKIDQSCLNDLDLIVLMKKDFNKRRIISISEIFLDNPDNNEYYQNIFQYNPETKKWDLHKNLFKTNTITKLRKFEDLNRDKFISFINLYKDIFEHLSKIKKVENKTLVDFFHKVSYYSTTSYKHLKDFWNNIKKNRCLNS